MPAARLSEATFLDANTISEFMLIELRGVSSFFLPLGALGAPSGMSGKAPGSSLPDETRDMGSGGNANGWEFPAI